MPKRRKKLLDSDGNPRQPSKPKRKPVTGNLPGAKPAKRIPLLDTSGQPLYDAQGNKIDRLQDLVDFPIDRIPRYGSKIRRLFDDEGFTSYRDVLLPPDLWDSRNRDPQGERAVSFPTINEAILYAEPVLHLARFYQLKNGHWKVYIVDSDLMVNKS